MKEIDLDGARLLCLTLEGEGRKDEDVQDKEEFPQDEPLLPVDDSVLKRRIHCTQRKGNIQNSNVYHLFCRARTRCGNRRDLEI